MLAARFAAGASTRHCDGQCCQRGVSVDLAERDVVLAHATRIQRAMPADRPRDPRAWFDAAPRRDADFPSGGAVRTALHGDACVFLDGRRRCVLHRVAEELKPFRCRAFPLTIERGVASLDPDGALRPLQCCGTAAGGPSRVVDVCPDELKLVLGPRGSAEP